MFDDSTVGGIPDETGLARRFNDASGRLKGREPHPNPMGLGWARWGFRLLALAGFAFVAGGVAYDAGTAVTLGFGMAGFGSLAAAWALDAPGARRKGALLVGLAAALAGYSIFFAQAFLPLEVGGYLVAILFWLAGHLLMSLGAFLWWRDVAPHELRVGLVRWGAAVALVAPLLWVPLDWSGGTAWQPGNVLALVGTVLITIHLKPADGPLQPGGAGAASRGGRAP